MGMQVSTASPESPSGTVSEWSGLRPQIIDMHHIPILLSRRSFESAVADILENSFLTDLLSTGFRFHLDTRLQ